VFVLAFVFEREIEREREDGVAGRKLIVRDGVRIKRGKSTAAT